MFYVFMKYCEKEFLISPGKRISGDPTIKARPYEDMFMYIVYETKIIGIDTMDNLL